jgi:hypothetical protein
MTTVISRVYKDASAAKKVTAALAEAGFPEPTYEVITAGDGAAEAMAAARVPEGDVEAYAAALTGKAAMLVIRAPFMPLGAARKAIELANAVESLTVDVKSQDV